MASHGNDFTDSVKTYYNDLKSKRYSPISREEERELLTLAQGGDDMARRKIAEANVRFVFDMARKFSGRGVPIGDLISEGNIGLMKSIDKFNLEKDVKFISYAVWWIRQSMFEAIEKNDKAKTYDLEIEKDNGGAIEDSVMDDDDVVSYGDIANGDDYSYEIGKEEQESLVMKLLSCITDKERDIIIKYYGLGDTSEKMTLQEISKDMDITSERVRQIKTNAMRKIRSHALLYEECECYL